jgi:hypothetical protein
VLPKKINLIPSLSNKDYRSIPNFQAIIRVNCYLCYYDLKNWQSVQDRFKTAYMRASTLLVPL